MRIIDKVDKWKLDCKTCGTVTEYTVEDFLNNSNDSTPYVICPTCQYLVSKKNLKPIKNKKEDRDIFYDLACDEIRNKGELRISEIMNIFDRYREVIKEGK